MTIQEALQRAVDQGAFRKAADGDDKAASYFVRYAAYLANPSGDQSSWGWLRKTGGGKNIDGYAEDALASNANPNDLNNVYDFVGGAGRPGATVNYGAGPVVRRPSDVWEAPRQLTAAEASYIGLNSTGGGGGGGGQRPGEYQDELDALKDQLTQVQSAIAGVPAAVVSEIVDDIEAAVQAAVEREIAETVADPAVRDGISESVRRAIKSQTYSARNRYLGTITLTPNE